MRYEHNETAPKKRPINLTIRADLIEQAKELELNTSQAAEAGIAAAVKVAREQAWRDENMAAIKEYNDLVAREGLPFPVLWPDD
jgi:antitoxin CcdA